MRAAWRRLTAGPDHGNWIVPGRIWACPYPRTDDVFAALADSNIRILINLHLKPHDLAHLTGYGLGEKHFPTPDFCPPAPDALYAAVTLMRQEAYAGYAVAVHCGGGLGRTGTVIACCLLEDCPDLSAAQAIARVRACRPGSIETRSQERAVRDFAALRITD